MSEFFSVRWLRGMIAAACFLLSPQLYAQSVAFTFDDGPNLAATPRLSPQARNEAILAALERHKVKAALFVTAGFAADRPEGLALARAWGTARTSATACASSCASRATATATSRSTPATGG